MLGVAMISIELTEQEANTAIMLMKMGAHSVPPADANCDGVIDAYVALRDKIKAGKPVAPTQEESA
jgi:hypothetical protein